VRLLTVSPPPPPPPPVMPPITPPVTPPVDPPITPGVQIVSKGTEKDLSTAAARELLADIDKQVKTGQTAKVSVSWVIEEGGER